MSNEQKYLSPVEFCREVQSEIGDMVYAGDSILEIRKLSRRLRVITVGQVYRALGEGFPEGGTCHVGWLSVGCSEVYFEPCVRVGTDCQAFTDGRWQQAPYPLLSDISERLASEYVALLGEPFASCYRKMMEEGQ